LCQIKLTTLGLLVPVKLFYRNVIRYDTIRYDTIEEFNVDSKAVYSLI